MKKTSTKKEKIEYVVVIPDIRSAHNVGSIFRTSDALGVQRVLLSGYTPCPTDKFDRPQKEIAKTALGAEKTIFWTYEKDPEKDLKRLKKEGFELVAIEQDEKAIDYKKFKPGKNKIALVVGSEVEGLSLKLRKLCDTFVEIPMKGEKESLNVSVAFGVAAFRITNI